MTQLTEAEIHLGAGRKIADLDIPGMPHLGSGITWDWTDKDGGVHPGIALLTAPDTASDDDHWLEPALLAAGAGEVRIHSLRARADAIGDNGRPSARRHRHA